MEYRSVASIMIVIGVLLVIALVGMLVKDKFLKFNNAFGNMLFSAVVGGTLAAFVIETMSIRVTR